MQESPVLRTTGGLMTEGVWQHPLTRALRDLDARLGVLQGVYAHDQWTDDPPDPAADQWIGVKESATRKGVSQVAISHALDRGDLIGRPRRPGGKQRVVSLASLERWQPNEVRRRAGIANRQRVARLKQAV